MMAWIVSGLSLPGAVFNVTTVQEFQNALTTAQANGQDDIINVSPGLYTPASTLTYGASASESNTLTIQCPGGGAVIDAGSVVSGTLRGMYIATSNTTANVTLDGLVFQNGRITNPDAGAGLLAWLRYGSLTVRNCVFKNNTANQFLAQVNAAGAYLRIDNSPGVLTVQNCVFTNNYANGWGGGAEILPSYSGAAVLNNNLFVSNSADVYGGGAYIYTVAGTVTLDNNTFTANRTGAGGSGGGGAYIKLYSDTCALNLHNNILWGNTSGTGSGGDIYVEDDGDGNLVGATVKVLNNDTNQFDVHVGNHLTLGFNTNANPLLTSDYHLRAASPCIDAGTNLSWMTNATDMDGQPRICNGCVDMGADEVRLAATQFAYANGIVRSVWDTTVDARCQLQACTNLVSGAWQDVGSMVTGVTRQVSLNYTNLPGTRQFYRLKWLRP